MQNVEESIYGSGKISLGLLKQMLRPLNDEKPGSSKLETLVIIYLTQISDARGAVDELYIKKLPDIIGCSDRAVYTILKSLEAKSLISIDYPPELNWSGVKNIRLLNNNYSGINKFTGKHRYLSTFAKAFDLTDIKNVKKLKALSLYALRLLLILAMDYDPQHGLRISCDRLCESLHIQDRSLIKKYLEELSVYLEDQELYTIRRVGHKCYGLIFLAAGHYVLKGSTPTEYQETYYKRKWVKYFSSNNFFLDDSVPLYKYLSYLFSKIYSLFKNGYNLSKIENILHNAFEKQGSYLDIASFYRACNDLELSLQT